MIGIDIKPVKLKAFQTRYIKFIHKFPAIIKKGLDQSAEQLKTIILLRTQGGRDFKNRRFTQYSDAYSELKGKTKVDLEDTNKMLQSIESRVINRNRSVVRFRNPREATKAMFHQTGAGNLPVRRFFDFFNFTEKVIQKQFQHFIKKEMRKFNV